MRVLHRCVHSIVVLMWKQLNIKLIMKSEDFSSKSVKIAGGKKTAHNVSGRAVLAGLVSQISVTRMYQ